MEIEFSLDDILEYFRQKGGKVIYTELVTYFKRALSNPETQANARVVFKNYVNQLATVINENGKKYLILRAKYMKKLFPTATDQQPSSSSPVKNVGDNASGHFHHWENNNILQVGSPEMDLSPSFGNNHHHHQQQKCMDLKNKVSSIIPNEVKTNTVSHNHPQHNNNHYSTRTPLSNLPTIKEIVKNNNGFNIDQNNEDDDDYDGGGGYENEQPDDADENIDLVPAPRPPPRKKNSFKSSSKTIPQKILPPSLPTSAVGSCNGANIGVANQQQHLQQSNDIAVVKEQRFESKCANTVQQEIQELSVRTPGRVKEHAQILNKLALDTNKLPMPSTANNQQVVTQKIRNTNVAHSDTDSGSVHLTDPLKKRWIIASSNCDYQEMLSLLKQDPELCRYCDTIMGYSSLHWAAKFNKPEVIKLIAGNYKVDPNIKSFSGSTPLHIAVQFKNEDIMKMLIYHYGANKDVRDNYGKKPYQYSEKEMNRYDTLNDPTIGNGNRPNALGIENGHNGNHSNNGSHNGGGLPSPSTENLKNNLRNKISHQSMLVRNKLRNTAFKRRKSMNEKSKQRKNHQSPST